ncbi:MULTISPECIES: peptide ABC transporter substrate-binding protein [Streptomyces]|uniref:ABC transporter substrate-binding protein n=2 Tax=Streptomyces rimosus subsp. rimosus TaxID=132474 RepID=A0A8A1URT3_STRR1|nr:MULTISPECIES: ABC transporter substrate-binding protein [Streptomyces]KOG79045.1 peptide ABC transporter substrate-binding protein [Kitasatospora aureofaciens]MYT47479.1 ABC transporter substrate-binding protein [Streptomyces sp. SID5471]KEF04324.1 peptide ABC transporter substrate-binding protein [Streptomyces rimosus]KEF17698.1 peptide ABC transporter substrate-binding protein [Streptomyces rimosus]KOT40949.1 peptide ABC transporter substrate-binding protein [Streptomyces rimosus subsp. r
MRGALRVGSAFFAAATVALAGAGCGGGGQDPSVVRASWGDPQNPVEPANTTDVQGGKVLDLAFRGLKRYNPRTAVAENMVAESVESPDARNFTVKLKPGWSFSNGEKVTARSFVDAWNYGALVSNRQLGAPFFSYVEGYEEVHPEGEGSKPAARTMRGLKVKDELTFTVRLNQKFGLWPEMLGYSAFLPLPRSFFTDHDAWLAKPVGNGPYAVQSYAKGGIMRLRTWKDYPGPDKAKNGGVDLQVYTDNDTAYTDLMAGNLDLVDDVPASQLKHVQKDLQGRYINQPAGIIQTLSFPMYEKGWAKPGTEKVRRGISMAINRPAITRQIFRGTRTPATDWTAMALGEHGGYQAGLCGAACTYDPAAARKLVDEGGGLPGGSMKVTYNADTGSHKLWVDALCNSVNRALGRHVCDGSPMGTFADYRSKVSAKKMSGPFRAGWQMDYPLIQTFLQSQYFTGASSNDSGWSNKEFDRLVSSANAESDVGRVNATYHRAERILAREMPAIPLWYQNGSGGYTDRVGHVALNPFSVPVYDQITIKD